MVPAARENLIALGDLPGEEGEPVYHVCELVPGQGYVSVTMSRKGPAGAGNLWCRCPKAIVDELRAALESKEGCER
jgi:hypothetical protein